MMMLVHELRVSKELTLPASTTQHNHSMKKQLVHFFPLYGASWIKYNVKICVHEAEKKKSIWRGKNHVNLLLFAAFLFSFSYFSSSSTPVKPNTRIHMSFSVLDVRSQEIGFYRRYSELNWKSSIFLNHIMALASNISLSWQFQSKWQK